jgi:hypothetical protein
MVAPLIHSARIKIKVLEGLARGLHMLTGTVGT